jgi:signal peptidase I
MNDLPFLKSIDIKNTLFIRGNSMFPFLKTGDIIILEKVPAEKLRTGDIVSFKHDHGDNVIVHRIVKNEKYGSSFRLLTKGDNNLDYDFSVPENDILGRVRHIIRGQKTIDLERLNQKFLSKIVLVLSKSNINFRRLFYNKFVNRLKQSSFLAKATGAFFSKKINCSVFNLDEGTILIKAFAGKRTIFYGELIYKENMLVIRNWVLKFPFYYTAHGDKLLKELISHCREKKLSRLLFEKMYEDNPVFLLIHGAYKDHRIETVKDVGTTLILNGSAD